MKICAKCKVETELYNFYKRKESKDGYHNQCKICYKKYQEYNSEKIKEYNKVYQKERRKNNPLYKFRHNTGTLIHHSFKRGANQFKKTAKTESILGCTIQEFVLFIESKFTKGMTLENYGKWHLDHIYPISLATTKEEIIKLNHYTNFQPLWAEDNIRKGNKVL